MVILGLCMRKGQGRACNFFFHEYIYIYVYDYIFEKILDHLGIAIEKESSLKIVCI